MMRRTTASLGFASVCALFVTACGEPPVEVVPTGPVLDYSGSWNPASNFGGPFGHDGQPVTSEHFNVYSGTASEEARRFTSDVAEEALGEVLDYLGLSADDFDFLPGNTDRRIDIMAIGSQNFRNNAGFAYRDGMVVISREAPNYRQFGYDESIYKRLMKHEGTHVVEFLLIGDPRFQQASHVWWREGFAHYTSRPRPTMIMERGRVEAWRDSHASLPGGGNPISVRVWNDFPTTIRSSGQTFSYYDMFELTVRYLLDPIGFGATPQDVVALYEELGQGTSFETAIARTLEVDVATLEAEYWERIIAYLDAVAPAGG
ncbi:MAG: hypothetical protein AAF389_11985 [Gemmatimonadota bacterium]